MKLALQSTALLLWSTGIGMVAYHVGWPVALGLFFIGWGTRLDDAVRREYP